MLAFGGRDAEGIGGSPAVGAEGIRGKEFICVGTGADGIKAGFEVRGWDGCEGIGAKCAGSDATGNAELTLDWTGAEGIIADLGADGIRSKPSSTCAVLSSEDVEVAMIPSVPGAQARPGNQRD